MRQVLAAALTLIILGALGAFVAWVSRPRARSLWLLLFACIVGGGITMMTTHAFIDRWGIRFDIRRDGLWTLMDGTANRPFVFRRMAPDIVRVATEVIENQLPRGPVDSFLNHSTLVTRYGVAGWERSKQIAFHVAFILVWLASFCTIFAGVLLLRTLEICSALEAFAASIFGLSMIPLTLAVGGYLYDAPELLIWTVLLLVALRGKLLFVPIVFALMAYNKESALLAVPALIPILSRRQGRKAALAYASAMTTMGVLWIFYVRAKYASSHGVDQGWLLLDNLAFWGRPGSYFRFSPLFSPALPAPRGGNVAILLLLFLPIRFGWRSLRSDIKWAVILLSSVLFPLFFVCGAGDETRALALLFPFLLILLTSGARELCKQTTATT